MPELLRPDVIGRSLVAQRIPNVIQNFSVFKSLIKIQPKDQYVAWFIKPQGNNQQWRLTSVPSISITYSMGRVHIVAPSPPQVDGQEEALLWSAPQNAQEHSIDQLQSTPFSEQ